MKQSLVFRLVLVCHVTYFLVNCEAKVELSSNQVNLKNFISLQRCVIASFFLNCKSFLLPDQNRACSKMKSAQWGFSFTKSNIDFLKQLCLYFNYMTLTV